GRRTMNREINNPDPSPEQRREVALQRLQQSRSALIVSLSPKESLPAKNPQPASASGPPSSSLLSSLASRVERNGLIQGGGRALWKLARRWWTRQPWHSSVELVSGTVAH